MQSLWYPVGYLLIWQPSNWQEALAPNLITPFSHFDPLVVKLKTTVLAPTLSLFSNFRNSFNGSINSLMSTSKRHLAPIYI